MQYVYKMGKSTVTSEPKVTYKDTVTKEEGTASASAITLGMVNSRISVEVIQSEATAAGVTFTLNLTNNGNQKISDIKITDDQGNRVNGDSFALAIGENRQLTYNVVTEEERYVTFSITGVTTSGDKYEDKTKSYVVRKYIDPDLLGIQFTAAVTETLNSAGSIGVRFDINNTGTMTMTNLVISMEEAYTDENGTEQTKLNEIYRTDTVPAGNFETTQTVYVGEPRDLTFAVQMNDPAGNPYTYTAHIKAEVLGVRNVQETDDAQQSAISTLGAKVGDSISKALTIALIVLAVLTVISVIAMAVLTSLEKKQRRKLPAAAPPVSGRCAGSRETENSIKYPKQKIGNGADNAVPLFVALCPSFRPCLLSVLPCHAFHYDGEGVVAFALAVFQQQLGGGYSV